MLMNSNPKTLELHTLHFEFRTNPHATENPRHLNLTKTKTRSGIIGNRTFLNLYSSRIQWSN